MRKMNGITVLIASIAILVSIVGCGKKESQPAVAPVDAAPTVQATLAAECAELKSKSTPTGSSEGIAEPNYPGFSTDEFTKLAEKLSQSGSSIKPEAMLIWMNFKANQERDKIFSYEANHSHSIDTIAAVLEKPYEDEFAKHMYLSNRIFDVFGTPFVRSGHVRLAESSSFVTSQEDDFISVNIDKLHLNPEDVEEQKAILGGTLVLFSESNGVIIPVELAILDKDSGEYKIYNLGKQESINLKAGLEKKIVENARKLAIQKSGVPPDNVVIWETSNNGASTPGTSQARIHFNQVNFSTVQDLAEYMGSSAPQIDPKGEFEKTDDYEKRLAQAKVESSKDQLQKLCGKDAKRNEIMAPYLNGGGLGNPVVTNVTYNADKGQFLLQIASTTTDYRLPMAINVDPIKAPTMKDDIVGMKPTVVYELKGEMLTARAIQLIDPKTGNTYHVNFNSPVNLKFNEASAKEWAAENDKKLEELAKQQAIEKEAREKYAREHPTYARLIMKKIRTDWQPCQNFINLLGMIDRSGSPDYIKERQVDKIIDSADRARCLVY
ncbi:MAG: hypothetical protein KKD65_12800 [Gammaproteobacteria bacterium]|nr:hypothetical protein [Gammaproteobacteria bacterium]